MALRTTPIRILRSLLFNKRPNPTTLLSGQPALNYNRDQPGLFFSDDNSQLVKIGPCSVGEHTPNSSLDPAGAGTDTNSKGELWLDMADPLGPTLKVFTGTEWVNATPLKYARVVVQDTPPDAVTLNLPEGTLWWNSANGLMHVLYGAVPDAIWVQTSASAFPVS